MIRCRLYRATSSLVSSAAGSTSGGSELPDIDSSSGSRVYRTQETAPFFPLPTMRDPWDQAETLSAVRGLALGVGPRVGPADLAVLLHRVRVAGHGVVELGDEV